MATLKVVDRNGKPAGEVTIAEGLMKAEGKRPLLHDAVVAYQRNMRRGTSSTKNRARVRGSGAKPWRQKGTGRARSGSRKSPIWRGGGVVFGPEPRDFRRRIPKAQKKAALASALAAKLSDGAVVVVDAVVADAAKTKSVAAWLGAIGAARDPLIVAGAENDAIRRAARNIPGVEVVPPGALNARMVLAHGEMVMEKSDFEALQEKVI